MALSNVNIKKLQLLNPAYVPGGEAPQFIEYEYDARALLDTNGTEHTYEQILALIQKAGRIVVLDELPTASAQAYEEYKDAIVLVPSTKEGNVKDEYVIVDNGASADPRYAWEKVGDTHIDLSGYALKGTYTTSENGSHDHAGSTTTSNTYNQTQKKLSVSRTQDVSLEVENTQQFMTGLGAASTDAVLGADATFKVNETKDQKKLVTSSIVPAKANGQASFVTITSDADGASRVTKIDNGQTVAEIDREVTVVKTIDATAENKNIMSNAQVSDSGVLSFGFVGIVTDTFNSAKEKKIADYTLADAAIPVITKEDKNIATVDTAVTYATGALAANGSGATVMVDHSISVEADNKDTVTAVTGYSAVETMPAVTDVDVQNQPVVALSNSGATGIDFVESIAKGEDETKAVTVVTDGAHQHTTTI